MIPISSPSAPRLKRKKEKSGEMDTAGHNFSKNKLTTVLSDILLKTLKLKTDGRNDIILAKGI